MAHFLTSDTYLGWRNHLEQPRLILDYIWNFQAKASKKFFIQDKWLLTFLNKSNTIGWIIKIVLLYKFWGFFFWIQFLTVSLASFMLYIVCMMCRHFLKMGHLNVHIVTHTEESRWSSCSYSVISHQPYLSSKIGKEIIRMEVNLDPFFGGILWLLWYSWVAAT